MYRILLAEDESDVLTSIIENVPWISCGFEKPVGCANGQEAIDCIKNGYSPHLVITDICMPIKDGLELTSFIDGALPDTLVVVLSGYDDFSYAQAALKLQVFDYILKPVTPNQFVTLLSTTKDELDKRALRQTVYSHEALISHFFGQLVTRPLETSVIKKNLEGLNIALNKSPFRAVSADISLPHPLTSNESHELELMRFALQNIISDLCELDSDLASFVLRDGTSCIIFSGGKSSDSFTHKFLSEINYLIKYHLGQKMCAGVGLTVDSLGEIYKSFRQGSEALSNSFYSDESGVLIFDSRLIFRDASKFNRQQYEKEFWEAIRTFSEEKALVTLESMFLEFEEIRTGKQQCIHICQRILLTLSGNIRALLTDLTGTESDNIGIRSSPDKILSLTSLKEEFLNAILNCFKVLRTSCDDQACIMVIESKEFIKNHLSDPTLSLGSVTKYLAVSASYFSSTFKAYTGMTFLEYLSALRMESAKKILTYTDKRAYEVAENVGFSDPHYFSTAFKKATGLSPREYRFRNKISD